MRPTTLDELAELASAARESVWEQAGQYNREPKIYLHWMGGHYGQFSDHYHIMIDQDGSLYTTGDLSVPSPEGTYHRNTGSVCISFTGCWDATTENMGSEPPTDAQIEAMAQVIDVVAEGLWLTIDRDHVMTHGEAADNIDGIYASEPYGPTSGALERWDLQYLGTAESPEYVTDYDDPRTGGNIERGKANWYRNRRKNNGAE